MIVPQYWAEARLQHRDDRRQVTVRRFGWSDDGQAEAQANAEARAREALTRLIAGETLPRRERKVGYGGAPGVPIREEIVSRHGDTIITRNSYGARCLNTPNVLFADIDFEDRAPRGLTLSIIGLLMLVAVVLGQALHSLGYGIGFAVLALVLGYGLGRVLNNLRLLATGGVERMARRRIAGFLDAHPDWHLRLYRTPSGLRALAMHRTFDPEEPAVAECFGALGVDPHYTRLCLEQHCFRARVSPKPWRISLPKGMRLRPDVWPVSPERLSERDRWIEAYEEAARGHASCRFIEAIGSKAVVPEAQAVQLLHDELCQAATQSPLA